MRTGPAEDRRGFLRSLTAALGAVLGALAVIPGLGPLLHPLRRDTVRGAEEPIRVASPEDLQAGRPVRVNVTGRQRDAWLKREHVRLGACWLIRGGDGRIRALSTVCPHLGCGIDWNATTRRFECPCHGSVFGADGRVLAGPSPRPMDELEVVATDTDVSVRYQRFRVGTVDKEPIG